MVKTALLAIMLCCTPHRDVCPIEPAIRAIGHGIHRAFYAVTNFYVNHIQPNQKGEPGKVVQHAMVIDNARCGSACNLSGMVPPK